MRLRTVDDSTSGQFQSTSDRCHDSKNIASRQHKSTEHFRRRALAQWLPIRGIPPLQLGGKDTVPQESIFESRTTWTFSTPVYVQGIGKRLKNFNHTQTKEEKLKLRFQHTGRRTRSDHKNQPTSDTSAQTCWTTRDTWQQSDLKVPAVID
jgi:hypothetical protein